jgi:hypothetical protein
MIDPFRETMMPLAKAARSIPGRTVSPQSVYRWISHGIEGVKLEALNVGGRMQTSQEALARFFHSVTEVKQRSATDPNEDTDRPERTEQALEAAGLL